MCTKLRTYYLSVVVCVCMSLAVDNVKARFVKGLYLDIYTGRLSPLLWEHGEKGILSGYGRIGVEPEMIS